MGCLGAQRLENKGFPKLHCCNAPSARQKNCRFCYKISLGKAGTRSLITKIVRECYKNRLIIPVKMGFSHCPKAFSTPLGVYENARLRLLSFIRRSLNRLGLVSGELFILSFKPGDVLFLKFFSQGSPREVFSFCSVDETGMARSGGSAATTAVA